MFTYMVKQQLSGCKMGHVTIVDDDIVRAKQKAKTVKQILKVIA